MTISTAEKLPNRFIVEAIHHFSLMRAYKMDKIEVMAWANTLERLLPDIDPLALCWLVEEMMCCRYPYDKNAGIQQLVAGLGNIEKVGNSYQFKTDFPG